MKCIPQLKACIADKECRYVNCNAALAVLELELKYLLRLLFATSFVLSPLRLCVFSYGLSLWFEHVFVASAAAVQWSVTVQCQ